MITETCFEVANAWEAAATQLGIFCLIVGYLIGRFMPRIITRITEWYRGRAPE